MHRSIALAARSLAAFSLLLATAACGSPSGSTDSDPSSSSSSGAATTTTDATTSSGTSSSSADTSSSGAPETSEGSSSSGGEVELNGDCELADRVGSFLVGMEADYTAFSGSVADGVVPVSVLEQVGEDGDCILLRRNNPFCDPLCMPGQTCDFDGNCIPYPANHDVGVVSVSGLAQPVMLDPVPPTFSYFDTSLPHPGFEPGAVIALDVAGGDYSPFELHGIGVEMVVPTAESLVLSTNTPVTVEWTPSDARTKLRLVLGVDQHGITPVGLVCEAPADQGSLEISAEIMTQFLEAGISGFPSADYYLETEDSVTIEPGCVELVVRSHDQTMLSVEGHTPCDAPNDCPKGQLCDLKLQTCVPEKG